MTITDSKLSSRFLVMPEHMNPAGTAFGGVIVSWMDIVAAMCAEKYSSSHAVTVSIDCLSFLRPVHAGDHVAVSAMVVYAGNTSIEVDVTVRSENPVSGDSFLATNALFTFVAMSREGEKMRVPSLDINSEEDRRIVEEAGKRHAYKKKNSGSGCRE